MCLRYKFEYPYPQCPLAQYKLKYPMGRVYIVGMAEEMWHVKLPLGLRQAVKVAAANEGKTIAEWLTELIEERLEAGNG